MIPLSKMTEEELKTLCKSLEAEYIGNSTVTIKQSDFNNMWASIDRYAKENKRLQEQLDEANLIISDFRTYDFTINDECAEEYQVKYGIKGKRIYTNRKPPKEYYAWCKKNNKVVGKEIEKWDVK